MQRGTKRVPLRGARMLKVHNVHGDVRCRGTGEEEVELIWNAQRPPGSTARPSVEIHRHRGRMSVRISWLGDPGLRVDLTVVVPASLGLDVATSHGLIETRGVHGEVDLTTGSGSVLAFLETGGRVQTKSGRIEAVLPDQAWDEPITLRSHTGDISAWLREGASAEIAVRAARRPHTDPALGVTANRRGRYPRMRLELGQAESSLRIRTVSGQVSLYRIRP